MQEKLSAMMDSELSDRDLDALIASMNEDDDAAECWHHYHLISDALSGQPAVSGDFMARFAERFDAEPVVLAPGAMRARPAAVKRHWVALSMAASVALVSATAWYVSQPAVNPQAAPYVAVNEPAQQADSDINPYLVAHQDVLGNPGFNHRAVILTEADAERKTAH
jgi:sigma-E factor negative regulatory protein RseA